MAMGVFELHRLNKQIVFRIKSGGRHWRLKVKAQPLLNADVLQLRGALSEVQKQHEIEDDRRRKNRITAEEIHLDLHRIVQPTEDINVVPTFFVITARRVIVDANLVKNIAVKLRVKLGLEDMFEYAQLRLLLRFERLRIVEHFAVAIAQN